jgi:hypothetical protein
MLIAIVKQTAVCFGSASIVTLGFIGLYGAITAIDKISWKMGRN